MNEPIEIKNNKDYEELIKAIENILLNLNKKETFLFSYDEKLKCSNSKGFLLATI